MLKKWLQVLCGETAWVVSDHMASGPGEQTNISEIEILVKFWYEIENNTETWQRL